MKRFYLISVLMCMLGVLAYTAPSSIQIFATAIVHAKGKAKAKAKPRQKIKSSKQQKKILKEQRKTAKARIKISKGQLRTERNNYKNASKIEKNASKERGKAKNVLRNKREKLDFAQKGIGRKPAGPKELGRLKEKFRAAHEAYTKGPKQRHLDAKANKKAANAKLSTTQQAHTNTVASMVKARLQNIKPQAQSIKAAKNQIYSQYGSLPKFLGRSAQYAPPPVTGTAAGGKLPPGQLPKPLNMTPGQFTPAKGISASKLPPAPPGQVPPIYGQLQLGPALANYYRPPAPARIFLP